MSKQTEHAWKSLSALVGNILNSLEEAKADHLSAADEIGHSIDIFFAGKGYWDGVDEQQLRTTATGTSAINYLGALNHQAFALQQSTGDGLAEAQALQSSISSSGSVISTVNVDVSFVPGFNSQQVYDVIDKPGRDEKYALKFDAFDAELGKLYRQVLQIRTRTTGHPAKSVLSDVRQLYDHLMRKLAPDDKVRAQSDWKSFDPDKPNMVTRRQRRDYAIEKHVADTASRATLSASTEHVLTVYQELNKHLHKDQPIDVDKAQDASRAMMDVLNQWADALGLLLTPIISAQ